MRQTAGTTSRAGMVRGARRPQGARDGVTGTTAARWHTPRGGGRRVALAAALAGAVAAAAGVLAAAADAQTPPLPVPILDRDVNGDGLADVALPDLLDSIDADGVSVIFGSRDRAATPSRQNPGERGFRITFASGSVADAELIGDANGDGLADVLVTDGGQGEIAVVYGKRDTQPVVIDDAFAPGGKGVRFEVDAIFAAGAGDVNGDGLADVIHVQEGRRRLARVRFGAKTRPFSRGFTIAAGRGIPLGPRPMPAAVGDFNGDRRDDVAVAVPDRNGRASGFDFEQLAFVVWGKRDQRTVTVSQPGRISTATARIGRRAAGAAISARSGSVFRQIFELGSVGDLDGDRREELAVTYGGDVGGPGRVDIVRGTRSAKPVVLPGRAGGTLTGADWLAAPAGIGDLTGDDRPDVLLGSPGDDGGLVLLDGRRARSQQAASRLGDPVAAGGVFTYARAAGDFDGDGRGDLLLGFDSDDFVLVYGQAPFPAFSIRDGAPRSTPLRCETGCV